VQAQPDQWKEMGQPEVLEQLDYKPAQFFWLRTIRPKFIRLDQSDQPPMIVPAPFRVIERGIASPGLLAQILVSRFVNHLPYYRQEQIYHRRHGVWLPRQQMVGWVTHCAAYMDGIYRAMVDQVRQTSYVQIDETPITYLDVDEPKGSSKGYFWTYLLPKEQVIFDWYSSRAAACLNRVLGDRFEGKIQCDAYGGYQSYASGRKSVMLFGCWAHCRRRFYEALDQDPRVVGWILNQIQRLYLYERELRESRAGPNQRAFIRGWKSRPIIKRLQKTFTKLLPRYLPKSAMGKALSYALKQ
jgi:transposase